MKYKFEPWKSYDARTPMMRSLETEVNENETE